MNSELCHQMNLQRRSRQYRITLNSPVKILGQKRNDNNRRYGNDNNDHKFPGVSLLFDFFFLMLFGMKSKGNRTAGFPPFSFFLPS